LERLGHVLRKDVERAAKKLLEGTPRAGRKKGRPGFGRRDEVEEEYGCKKMENIALARTEWQLS
jgi:hypothetical protein